MVRAMVDESAWEERGDRAVQIWTRATTELQTLLEAVAHQQRLVTYTDVVSEISAISMEPRSTELARLMCERTAADAQEDRPLLSSIVIGRRTNRPGRGFFDFARKFFQFEDEETFWLTEVSAVHEAYRRRSRRRRTLSTPHRVRIETASPVTVEDEKDFIMSFFD